MLSVEVEITGYDAERLRDFAARFGYSSLATAIVALVVAALETT